MRCSPVDLVRVFGAPYYGMAPEGLLSLHHRLQMYYIVNVNTCRKRPDDIRLLQVLANTYISRIKNYVKKFCKRKLKKKKSNTAKGVNIATEFNEFKGTLFNKKIIRHKMRRIQGKKQ